MCIREHKTVVPFAVYKVIVLDVHRSPLHMHVALRQVVDARQGSTFAQETTPCRFHCFYGGWSKAKISQIVDDRAECRAMLLI